MQLVIIGVLLLISIALTVYSLRPKQGDREVVRRRLTGNRGEDDVADIRERARQHAREDLVKKATPMLTKLIMPTSDEDQTNLRLKLACAGYRNPQGQTIFLASKSICAVVGLIIGVVYGITTAQELAMLMGATAFCAGLGFMLPNMWLSMAANSRKEKIRHALPDTLDLLVVSVESGLALDGALKRVGDEMAQVHKDISDEMRIATMEGQMGIPRGEALENMARRTGLEEVRSLVSVILQAEKFGTSIARALRNQAESLRSKRRQAAEERAQKTAVKLMLPLVLFIFPAMGVVLAGPAAIRMIETLKDNPSLGGG